MSRSISDGGGAIATCDTEKNSKITLSNNNTMTLKLIFALRKSWITTLA